MKIKVKIEARVFQKLRGIISRSIETRVWEFGSLE